MDLVVVSVVGGLLALDATSSGQFMLSRPIVAGAIVGAVVGDAVLGLAIGAVLELYLLVSFPTGGARFPEGPTATAVAVAVAANVPGAGALPLAVAVGLVWGQLGGLSITVLRRVNARIVPGLDRPRGGPVRVSGPHLVAILLDFVRGVFVTLTGIVVGRIALRVLGPGWALGPEASRSLLLLGGAVSAGVLLRDLGGFRRRKLLFAAGMALGIIGARFL